MSSTNKTNTNIDSTTNLIYDKNYLKKLRIRRQNYGIATILVFFSGLGLSSISDFKKPNHFKKILNYTKPFVIFLSMPLGILTAINSIKLMSAKDFAKFYTKQPTNIINYYQKPSQINHNFINNSTKISSHHPANSSTSSNPNNPKPLVHKPQFARLSSKLKTPINSP